MAQKMLGNQQSEVCIACLQGRVFIAMPVYSDNAVCVFIYNSTLGVHAEGTHLISVFLGAVYDFTFVKLIGKMRKNLRGQFHAHTKVNAVDFVGISSSLQMRSIHLPPLRPTEMIHFSQEKLSSAQFTA